MKYFMTIIIAAIILMTGCKERVAAPDLTPPAAPRGLGTSPGDNFVEVYWLANSEPDVAGYNVYSSVSANGKYVFIGSTGATSFIDQSAKNGVTYYYTVSAFDAAGNESDLDPDVLSETPRPEGHNATISDYHDYPNEAGYDFSSSSIGPYDDSYTDMYFDYDNGGYYMDVWHDTEIQDLGYTNSLYTLEELPTQGWSPTKDVRLIAGHTYALKTWNHHYAKFRVIDMSSTRVTFEWAYQLQSDNARLKTAVGHRGALIQGTGAAARHP